MNDEEMSCVYCGYDFKTDTINPSLVKSTPKKGIREVRASGDAKGIDPRVKKFAFIGIAIIAFSIFYRYRFDVTGFIHSIRQLIPVTASAKGKTVKRQDKKNEKVGLLNVKFFDGSKKIKKTDGLTVEGISFFQTGKSVVIISGRVLFEGESIAGVKVMKINKDSVEVIINGENKSFTPGQSIPMPEKK
jgi:hypothetical protein